MPLPTSREETCVPAGQIKSNTINKIQDAIVGHKHGELEYSIGPMSFRTAGSAVVNLSSGELIGPGTGFTTEAAIEFVPVGSRITAVRFKYKRNNTGTVTRKLLRWSGGVADVLHTSDDTTGNGAIDALVSGINHIVAANYLYALYLGFDATADGGGGRLYGGSVLFDRL